MVRRRATLALSGLLGWLAAGCTAAPAAPDAGTTPVVDASDGAAPGTRAKIVFLAGGPSHGPGEHEYTAGSLLLARLLTQTPGIEAQLVRDNWPTDLSVFDGARAIVVFCNGNVGHPLVVGDRLDTLAARLRGGVGLVVLHWAVHFPDAVADRVLPLLGGYYSDAISVNPVWPAEFAAVGAHPIGSGVPAFALTDEWYYNLRFAADGVVPLLQAVPPEATRFTADAAAHPGRAETVAWAFARPDGGRSFGFTGAHFHRNWGDESVRRLVLNAILWAAGLDVPPGGVDARFDPAWLLENLDPK